MSVIVPELDLAPSVTSRVVTIDVIDMQEGAPAGGSVDFILAADLHVPADDKIIQAGSVTVTLDAAGHGEVRLPTYDPDVRPDGWGILVKKSWAPHPYLIRVPEGTTKISLADIEPVQEADPSLVSWLLTGASVQVVEGAQWGATVTTSGGVATFRFTVPPGGTAYFKGGSQLTTAANLDTIEAGIYSVGASSVASALGLPNSLPGYVECLTMPSGYIVQRFSPSVGSSAPARVFKRVRPGASAPWSTWTRVDGNQWNERVLPNGTDLNSWARNGDLYRGPWSIPSEAASATMHNLPVTPMVGEVEVHGAPGFQTVHAYNKGLWWRGLTSVGQMTWSPWVRLDQPEDPNIDPLVPDNAGADHDARVRALLKSKGGGIGTGGVAALALRFDDWHAEFETLVAPTLRAYQLPCFKAITPVLHEQSGVTWAAAKKAAHDDAFEITCHSWDHTSATGVASVHRAVVESADYLEAQVDLPVRLWTFPGTSAGQDAFDGIGTGKDLGKYTSTYAGLMLLSRYAVVRGEIRGHVDPLAGTPSIGQSHWTIEAFTLAQAQDVVRAVQRLGAGVTLMIHPYRIDTPGYMTAADFDAFCAWLAAEREALRLHILTGTGLAVADAATSRRMQLLANPDFEDGLTGWSGSGWTEAAGIASTSGTTALVQAVDLTEWSGVGWLRGESVQVETRARAASGATIRVAATGTGLASETILDLPPDGTWRTVYRPVTFPRAEQQVQIAVTRLDGGPLDVDSVHVNPI